MIKIGILGDIGSGKSFVAKLFGYPVFSADKEVSEIYKKDRDCYKKLNQIQPNLRVPPNFLDALYGAPDRVTGGTDPPLSEED